VTTDETILAGEEGGNQVSNISNSWQPWKIVFQLESFGCLDLTQVLRTILDASPETFDSQKRSIRNR
jgi:hypothetical protein